MNLPKKWSWAFCFLAKAKKLFYHFKTLIRIKKTQPTLETQLLDYKQ